MLRLAWWMVVIIGLGGCAAPPREPVPDDPGFAPVIPDYDEVEVVPTGSLFQDRFSNNLFSDIKARQVGDLITVELREATSARKKASTSLAKDKSLSLSPFSLGGAPVTIKGHTIEASLEQEQAFDGSAGADQSNSLQGQISVSVVRILPNGNLVVRGEKWMMLNNGNEFIRLTGIIRPEDVDSENTVNSNRIANARIQYGGTGDFASTQEQGWLSRFFNGPIWPF